MLNLEVSLIRQWGREEYRPECVFSRGLIELMKRKVFTTKDIEKLKELGFRITLKGGVL